MDFPNPGIESGSPALQVDSFSAELVNFKAMVSDTNKFRIAIYFLESVVFTLMEYPSLPLVIFFPYSVFSDNTNI